MKLAAAVLFLVMQSVAAEHFTPPFSSRTDVFWVAGIKVLGIEVWGAKGDASVESPIVPAGEIWVVRGCGIISEDGTPVEYMLQLALPFPGHKPNPQLLVPIRRETGKPSGTPVLALERDIKPMLPGEWISARANGLHADKKMGIRMSVYVFPVGELPRFLRQ
jgi:hypothetical protein